MSKLLKNIVLVVCAAGAVILVPLFLTHNTPLPAQVPQINMEEILAKKEAAQEEAKNVARKTRLQRIYACAADEDCLIVDKDLCGCAAGPSGVTAINVNHIAEFYKLNRNDIAKACPSQISTERECSPNARAVCRASVCKIVY